MARASAAVAAQTARDILSAAAELFAKRGISEVSVEDVAVSAGVTRGAVYHHYRNKNGLFEAVAAHLQSRVAAAVVRTAEGAGSDPVDQLRAGCHGFLEAITSRSTIQVLLIDAPAALGWGRWRRLDAENSAVHLRHALAAVGIAPTRLDATTALLSGAMNEAALWIAEQSPNSPAQDEARRVLDDLIDACLP